VLERFPNYWNKGEIHFDRVVFLADSRFDGAPRESAFRPARFHRAARRIRRAASKVRRALQDRRINRIGYQGITINVGKS